MGDAKTGGGDGAGWLPFDLLGHPVAPNKGCKGRPQHVPTPENLEKAVLLYAQRKTDAEVAAALGISIPTLKEHYFSTRELQAIRRNARAFVEGELLVRLNRDSKAGKTGATEKLLKRLDKAGLSALSDQVKNRGKADKVKPLGKKELQKQAAGQVSGRFAPRAAPGLLIN